MKAFLDVKADQVINNLRGAMRATGKSAFSVVYDAANDIMEESRKQVPVDTGTLLDSSYVDIKSTSRETVAQIGYGRNDVPNPKSGELAMDYMIQVHEDLSVVHKNGKAKFLEDPFNDYMRGLSGRKSFYDSICDAVASVFGRFK